MEQTAGPPSTEGVQGSNSGLSDLTASTFNLLSHISGPQKLTSSVRVHLASQPSPPILGAASSWGHWCLPPQGNLLLPDFSEGQWRGWEGGGVSPSPGVKGAVCRQSPQQVTALGQRLSGPWVTGGLGPATPGTVSQGGEGGWRAWRHQLWMCCVWDIKNS